MKSLNNHISLFFAAVFLFGTTLSAIHIHYDDFSDVETHHMVVEEEFHCVICGSVLKSGPDVQEHDVIPGYPEQNFTTEVVTFPLTNFVTHKDGRAPPSLA